MVNQHKCSTRHVTNTLWLMASYTIYFPFHSVVTDTYTAPIEYPLITHIIPAHREETAPALVEGASLEFFHNRGDFYKIKSNFLL